MYPHSNTGIALSSYMKPHPLETQSEKSPSAGASTAFAQPTQPSQPVPPSQYLISEPLTKKPDKGKC